MNEPPIPSPTPGLCPRCGVAVAEGQTYCPNCGTALKSAASPGLTVGKILGAICLGGLALIAGAIGTCAAIMTPFTIGDDIGSGAMVFGIAALGFGFAALCIYGIVRIVKR